MKFLIGYRALNKYVFMLFFLMVVHPVYGETYGRTICEYPGFYCRKVKRGETWATIFPKQMERDLIKRLNRMNTAIYAGMVIAVPETLENMDIMDFSPFPKQIDPPNEKLIIIDPNEQAWASYDMDGTLIKWGPASSGADWCKDIDGACYTEAGTFRIFSLGSSDCYSTKFPLPDGGAPMPYCMYFHGGQALHGEPNGLPGYNASHGCVRLFVNDAEWLRYSFVEGPNANNKYLGTKVIVNAY